MIAAEVAVSMNDDSIWKNVADMERWCIQHLGPEARERDQVSDEYPWCTRYHSSSQLDGGTMWWYFAREEYASIFALRWL
jgi:hypothetical protein